MNISKAFNNQPWAAKLARRKNNFEFMCEHMAKVCETLPYLVETGSAWDKGNWDGQGQSTLIWDWLVSELHINVLSIDITPSSTESAKSQTKHVIYETADSVKTLNEFHWPEKIGLLYLDSRDWTEQENLDSAFHHMMELTTVWARLPSGCLVVVDDRHGDMRGKHWLVEAFLTSMLKLTPAFKNHQIGWIKP